MNQILTFPELEQVRLELKLTQSMKQIVNGVITFRDCVMNKGISGSLLALPITGGTARPNLDEGDVYQLLTVQTDMEINKMLNNTNTELN